MKEQFPLLYFGPTEFYKQVIESKEPIFVKNERYLKQTLRSRCNIYGANGIIQLSIPIQRVSNKRMNLDEVLIDYSSPWQKIHWRSIRSAYGKTAFFEYFSEDIHTLYQEKHESLFAFLNHANNTVFRLIGSDYPEVRLLEPEEIHQVKLDDLAYKNRINSTTEYFQAFSDKHGFIAGLSILDWLFNCGKRLQ